MYKVLVERAAARELKRAPEKDYVRLVSRLGQLTAEPRPRGCRKLHGSKKEYRIRVGDWRVVYEIDGDQQIIYVLRIVLRKNAYR